MTYPSFNSGEVLTASDMNAVGLWKVTSGSISALSTTGTNITSIFNNTNYKNYRIILQITAASTSNRLQLQMLLGTTPATTGAYYAGGLASDYAANTTLYFQRSNGDTSLFLTNTNGSTNRFISFDIYGPNQAITTMFSNGSYIDTTGIYHYAWGGAHAVATAYDGIKLATNTGTMDVTYAVYGYKP